MGQVLTGMLRLAGLLRRGGGTHERDVAFGRWHRARPGGHARHGFRVCFGRRGRVFCSFGFVRLDGFVRQLRTEFLETLEILDGAAVEALGLRLVAEQQRPTVGLARELVETGAEQEIPILGAGDFDIAAQDGAVHVDPGMAIGVAGFVEGGGEEAGFEAGGAEEGLLDEGNTTARSGIAR